MKNQRKNQKKKIKELKNEIKLLKKLKNDYRAALYSTKKHLEESVCSEFDLRSQLLEITEERDKLKQKN